MESDTKDHKCSHCFTALEYDLFAPRGFYAISGDKKFFFDSGFTIAVIPHLEYFMGEVEKVKKEMTGISSTAQEEEKET